MSDLILTAGDTTVKILSEGIAASTEAAMYTLNITAGGTSAVVSLENSDLIISPESKATSYAQAEDLILGQSPSLVISPIGSQGVQGERGEAGAGGAFTLPTGTTSIGGNRCVTTNNGVAAYADCSIDGFVVIGVSISAAEANAEVSLMTAGKITIPGASFTINSPVFVSVNGTFTSNVVDSVFSQQVGIALTEDLLLVHIYQPIIR